MTSSQAARDRLIDDARASGALDPDVLNREERRREEYLAFGVDVPVADLLAERGAISADALADAARGDEIPSKIAGLDVSRLAGGTPEHPLYLARRAVDGETFLVHGCPLRRQDAPADVDEFVRACERGRRLTGPSWIPVKDATLADGAYAAVTAVPDGMRLDEWLDAKGPFAPDDAVTMLRRLAEALWPLEALGVPAAFPDPSLVHVTPDGKPWLLSMEVLLSAHGKSGDLSEVARSAARLLARLVGPEHVADPVVRDLLSDLSAGRFTRLEPDRSRDLALSAATARTPRPEETAQAWEAAGAESTRTPVGLKAPTDAYGRRLPAAPPPRREEGNAPRPRWPLVLAGAAVLVIAGWIVSTTVGGRFGGQGAGGEGPPKAVGTGGRGEGETPQTPVVPRPGASAEPARETSDAALSAALANLEQHRADDPQGVIDRLRAVEARYGGTDSATKAAQRRIEFEREVEGDAERKAAAIVSDVDRFLSADEIGQAHAAIDSFPASLSFTKASAKVEAQRTRVKEKAEAIYAGLRPAIDAGALPGKQEAAQAAFERVRSLGDRDLTARAEGRLKDALDRAAGFLQRRKALESDLKKAVGEALSAAGAGEIDRARRVLSAAGTPALSEVFPDRLASAREAVERVVRAYALAVAAANARAGKALTFATREYGSKPFTVTVVDALGERLTYTRGGQRGFVHLGTVAPESIADLVLDGREADAAAVHAVATLYAACGQRALAEATLSKATALGASAGEFAAEASAVEAWLGVLARREVAAGDALLDRDRSGARAAYGRAAATAPFLPDPHRKLGELLLADKKTDEAFTELSRAKALGGGTVDVLYAIAKASAGKGDADALSAWRAFLASASLQDPRLEAARAEAERLATKVVRGSTLEKVKAANALLQAGKAAEAVTALEEAVSSDPSLLDARKALARAAEKAGDAFEAYVQWRAARDLSKSTKDATEAKEQMDRLERTQGERPAEAMVRKGGDEALARGEYATAADFYRRAVQMSPLDVEARISLGSALVGLGVRTNSKAVFEEGVAAFDAAIAFAPDDPRGWQGRAELRLFKGDAAGAIADATAALSRRKDMVLAYNTRARALYQSLQFDPALVDMTVVVTLMPLAATPRISRAQIYVAMGKYEEAEADLKAALERTPTAAEKDQVQALEQQVSALKKADGK